MSVGLLLVPALVFLLYVGAFYQPIDNSRNTTVLFVNLDGGELAQSMESAILSSGVYDFKVSSLENAVEQVNSAQAWGALIIPAGFEEHLRSENGAQLILLVDDSRSYIISRTMQPTMMVLVSKLQAQVMSEALSSASIGMQTVSRQEEYSSQSLNSLSQASYAMGAGQSKLTSSLSTLSDYENELTYSNLKLHSSLQSSVQAGWALSEGAGALRNGADSLSLGLSALHNGTSILVSTHSQLNYVLSNAYTIVQSMPDTTEKNQTLSLLSTANYISGLEYSGLQSVDSKMQTAYIASRTIHDGLNTLNSKLGSLTDGLVQISDAQLLSTRSMQDIALNTKTVSSASKTLQSKTHEVSGMQSLLASKSSSLSSSLYEGSSQLDLGGVSLLIMESNYATYRAFFATAFISLGLFFGAASAYIFCALAKLRHPTIWALCISFLQSIILLAIYCAMDFVMRSGEYELLAIMFLSSAVYVLMTRALVRVVSPVFEANHLSLYSPILSLLAVFMISSGGAMWPQHTLQAPFSSFTPFIPMYYTVSATRASALASMWPSSDVQIILSFCLIFWVLVELADHVRPKMFVKLFKQKSSPSNNSKQIKKH